VDRPAHFRPAAPQCFLPHRRIATHTLPFAYRESACRPRHPEGKNPVSPASRQSETRRPEGLHPPLRVKPLLCLPSARTWIRVALSALLACTSIARADVFQDGDRVMLQAGPFVYHLRNESDYNDLPLLIGVEWESRSHWELGASYFSNSYHQPCLYVYLGKRWFLNGADDGIYVKLTGGPLYGYRGEYQDKIPFNYHGLGIGVIPGIGYQYQRVQAQLVILGTAGLMVTIGYDLWR
jgi:hypothetical protein